MGRTILVADDSPTVQKKASGILTGEGLDVVTVSNGVAAVKKLPTVSPLVVLADVSMPGKDGYEVCEHIKSNAGLSHVPVILIFSDTDPYEEAKGARVSADGRIKKPFDRDELVATVAKFVAQAEAAIQKPAPAPAEPPQAFEVEPIDAEPEVPVKPQGPDFSALSGGMAFGVPGTEEISSTGQPEVSSIPSEPMITEVMPAEALPIEGEVSDRNQAPEPIVEPEQAYDAIADVTPAEAEAAPLASEPPGLVRDPDLITEPEAHPAEPETSPAPAEPVLVEEEMPAAHDAPAQSGEGTMMFRAPADIAQPVFSDEAETAARAAEAAVSHASQPVADAETAMEPAPLAEEPPPEATTGLSHTAETPPHGTPIASSTLESYTLNEAAEGHVSFAPSEPASVPESAPAIAEPEDSAPEPEVSPAPPVMAAEAPAVEAPEAVTAAETAIPEPEVEPSAPKKIDPAQLYSIVHKVVVKMSPPALSPQMIEDIARKFADEVVGEIERDS